MYLRLAVKIGFLLVIIGFFMPVACNQNGFELAKIFINADAVIDAFLIYLVFISAIAGIVLGIALLQKKKFSKGFDWLCLAVCVASGLIIYFVHLDDGPELQSGAYMILTGWIITFILLIIPESTSNKTTVAPDTGNVIPDSGSNKTTNISDNINVIVKKLYKNNILLIAAIAAPGIFLLFHIEILVRLIILAIPTVLVIFGQKKNNRKMILAAGIVYVFAWIYFLYVYRFVFSYFHPLNLLIFLLLLVIISSAVLCYVEYKKPENKDSISAANNEQETKTSEI